MIRRLLVVDDEEEFCAFARDVALELGYEVEVCTTPKRFAAVYERFQPTTVLLDVVMPEVDGLELVKWLAAKGSSARIIVASGFNPRYAKMASMIGADAGLDRVTTLRKPMRLADLQAALS
jgi:DNA-binding response OmpR family regulator